MQEHGRHLADAGGGLGDGRMSCQNAGALPLGHLILHVDGFAGAGAYVPRQFRADPLDGLTGTSEQVALPVPDAQFDQGVEFFPALDAFADDTDGAQATEVDQEADHVLADLVLIDAVHQFAIEFEPAGAEGHDAIEPAGAGADVVNGNLEARLTQHVDRVGKSLELAVTATLGDFKDDARGCEFPDSPQVIEDLRRKARVGDHLGRGVQEEQGSGSPVARSLHGHLPGHRLNLPVHARCLRGREQFIGILETGIGERAGEYLVPGYFAGPHVDNRLKDGREQSLVQRPAESGLGRHASLIGIGSIHAITPTLWDHQVIGRKPTVGQAFDSRIRLWSHRVVDRAAGAEYSGAKGVISGRTRHQAHGLVRIGFSPCHRSRGERWLQLVA